MLEVIEEYRKNFIPRKPPIHKATTIRSSFGKEKTLYYWDDQHATMVYHRTVGIYFTSIIENGFTVIDFVEPNLSCEDGEIAYPYPRFIIFAANLSRNF